MKFFSVLQLLHNAMFVWDITYTDSWHCTQCSNFVKVIIITVAITMVMITDILSVIMIDGYDGLNTKLNSLSNPDLIG